MTVHTKINGNPQSNVIQHTNMDSSNTVLYRICFVFSPSEEDVQHASLSLRPSPATSPELLTLGTFVFMMGLVVGHAAVSI